jgi:hypothetical protein
MRQTRLESQLRLKRQSLFEREAKRVVQSHATRLFMRDGKIFSETDGRERLIHDPINPRNAWGETWNKLRDAKPEDFRADLV